MVGTPRRLTWARMLGHRDSCFRLGFIEREQDATWKYRNEGEIRVSLQRLQARLLLLGMRDYVPQSSYDFYLCIP